MIISLLTLLSFSLFSALISADRKEHIFTQPWKYLFHGALSAYLLLLLSYFFLSQLSFDSIFDIHQDSSYNIYDLYLYSLWTILLAVFSLALGLCFRFWRQGCRNAFQLIFFSLQRKAVMLIFSLVPVLFCASLSLNLWATDRILISEVCSQNISVLSDEAGEYHDYVELYNPMPFPVGTRGLYLTDDLNSLPEPLYKNLTIPGNSYLVLHIDRNSMGFSLHKDGETLYLLSNGKQLIDSVSVPPLSADTVYARNISTLEWAVSDPSPMMNTAADPKQVIPLTFSAEAGFYDAPFDLSLTAPEGCTIYYTLDSSTPDDTSAIYTAPIPVKNMSDSPNIYRSQQRVVEKWLDYKPVSKPVDKAFVVRAVAIDEQGNKSDIVTKSYFVDMEKYQSKLVLSLVSDPDGLFGEDGIYVTGKAYDAWYTSGQVGEEPPMNFNGRGHAYEVEASAELFHEDLLMSQPVGLRLQGASARNGALKRFSIFSRPKYSGSRYFTDSPFSRTAHSFFTRMGDADVISNHLIADTGIGGLDSLSIAVFLDGEFWYSTYLRERYDETYIAQKFSVSEDTVLIAEAMPSEIYDFIESHPLDSDENYDALNEIMDIQNYITFLSANIYLCNVDTSELKNLRLWKSDSYSGLGFEDRRWRFLLYDADALSWDGKRWYGTDNYAVNTFSAKRPWPYPVDSYNVDTVFMAIRQNPRFCRDFALIFMDLANTCFEKEYVASVLAHYGLDRSWNNGFFDKRFDYIVPDMAAEFGLLGSLEEITLSAQDPQQGTIRINSVTPTLQNGRWSGKYYTDYPVTISAEAQKGYEFVAWHHEGNTYSDATIDVQLTEGDNLWEAEFRRIGGQS